MPVISRRTVAVAVALLAGCGRADTAVPSAGPVAACPARTGGSRWAASGSAEYRKVADYGAEPREWLNEIGGIVSRGDSVFVYAAPLAEVRVLDAMLRPLGRFGREGQGPGEMQKMLDLGMRGRGWRWMDLSGDTLLVYDGQRIQLFAPSGAYRGHAYDREIEAGAFSDEGPRVALHRGALLAARGGYHIATRADMERGSRWDLVRFAAGRAQPVLSLQLAPLPRSGGVPFNGPQQARPLWDVAGDCLVATDGTGGWLVRAAAAPSRVDTLPLTLPDLPLPKVDVADLERTLGGASRGRGGYQEPTAIRRISTLVIDPDGYVWLLPQQDSSHLGGEVEVVRVSTATGAAVRDTVPAFPAAFGPPGVFYARGTKREDGIETVARYELHSAPPP